MGENAPGAVLVTNEANPSCHQRHSGTALITVFCKLVFFSLFYFKPWSYLIQFKFYLIGTVDPAHSVRPVLFTNSGTASLTWKATNSINLSIQNIALGECRITGWMRILRFAATLVLSFSGQSTPAVRATRRKLSVVVSLPSCRYWKCCECETMVSFLNSEEKFSGS